MPRIEIISILWLLLIADIINKIIPDPTKISKISQKWSANRYCTGLLKSGNRLGTTRICTMPITISIIPSLVNNFNKVLLFYYELKHIEIKKIEDCYSSLFLESFCLIWLVLHAISELLVLFHQFSHYEFHLKYL